MKSKDGDDMNIKDNDRVSPEEGAIIDAVIKRAPQIKSYVEYKSHIPDSFHDEIPRVSLYKETTYTDLKEYGKIAESSRDLNTKTSLGLGALITTLGAKNFGNASSTTMGSIVGGTCYSIGDAHLKNRMQEYDIQSEIQKNAFLKGFEELGEEKVKGLAKNRCEENDLLKKEFSLDKINKASGDLYKDVVDKK